MKSMVRSGIPTLLLISLFSSVFSLASRAQELDTIKVMSYNLLNYTGSTPGRVDSYFRKVALYEQADIIAVQEVINESGANYVLTNGLNVFGITKYNDAVFTNSNSLNNHLYYNTEKLELEAQSEIAASPRRIDVYKMYVKNQALSLGDTTRIWVFCAHFKAGTGGSNEAQRNGQAAAINTYITNNPQVENYILAGDLNVYSSSEPAYQTLTTGASQKFTDPINQPGTWNNSSFAGIHTQSTRTTSFGGGATGGMDDRFDFILTDLALLQSTNKVRYIPHTYEEIGNDGQRYNKSLISSPPNSMYPDSVVQACYYMSDHLPVVASFEVESAVLRGSEPCGDLFLSEVVSGSGNDQAIEVVNPTNTNLNLANYELRFYPNGTGTLQAGNTLVLSGTIAPGGTYAVAGANAAVALRNAANDTSVVIDNAFDVNDAVILVNALSDDTLDVYGQVGTDPGAGGWSVAGTTSANQTLIRGSFVRNGSLNWATSLSEWTAFSGAISDSLGGHSYFPCIPDSAGCSELFISEYITGTAGNRALELYNPSNNPIVLTGNYFLRQYSGASATSFFTAQLSGVIDPKGTHVVTNGFTSLPGIVNEADEVIPGFAMVWVGGDDAIALFKGSETDTIDVIGEIGSPPAGGNWTITGTNGVNGNTAAYTLVRDSIVYFGQLDWSVGASSEWQVYPQNTTTYLGNHHAIGCDTATAPGGQMMSPGEEVPGISNDQVTDQTRDPLTGRTDDQRSAEEPVRLYPNPTDSRGAMFSRVTDFLLLDMHGRVIREGKQVRSLETSGLAPGMYIVRIPDQSVIKLFVR